MQRLVVIIQLQETTPTATQRLILPLIMRPVRPLRLKAQTSTLNISDAFTMQIDISDLSSQLNEFISQNPFGSFSLTDDDGGNFTVDSFNGQVRTTAEFKSAPQDSYEFEIQYTGKNGNNFNNKVTINRIYSEDAAKDSVADINVSTIDGATNAITILDRAIQQMVCSGSQDGRSSEQTGTCN